MTTNDVGATEKSVPITVRGIAMLPTTPGPRFDDGNPFLKKKGEYCYKQNTTRGWCVIY